MAFELLIKIDPLYAKIVKTRKQDKCNEMFTILILKMVFTIYINIWQNG